jgi:endoglucanase
MNRFLTLWSFCASILLIITSASARADDVVLLDASQKVDFGYGAFSDPATKFEQTEQGIHLVAKETRGGVGWRGPARDFSTQADFTPALTATVNPNNKAVAMQVVVVDQAGTQHKFNFDLSSLKPGERGTVTARFGAALGDPFEKPQLAKEASAIDLTQVSTVQLVGEWKGLPCDVVVHQVTLVPATDDIRQARAQGDEARARVEARQARQQAEKEKAVAKTLKSPKRSPDSPEVVHVFLAAPDVLAVTIQERQYIPPQQVPYAPQPGDEIVSEEGGKEPTLAIEKGKTVEAGKGNSLFRTVDGKRRKIGDLAINFDLLSVPQSSKGEGLVDATVALPQAYSIQSATDTNYAAGAQPSQVYWKRKPNSPRAVTCQATVYLKLLTPLTADATYTVQFVGVNTRQASVDFVNTPGKVRSDSVYTSHVGYRASDPYKRGFLSLWMGTGGNYSFGSNPITFHVLDDASGQSVFKGAAALVRDAATPENNNPKRNYALADVYSLDFSSFDTPGKYRLFVEGVGCSYPFEIGEGTWQSAFKVSMMGMLHQRSGIELGPPSTEFKKPIDLHPAHGTTVFQSKYSSFYDTAGGQGGIFSGLFNPDNRTEEPVAEGWGGYHDAADWDRGVAHLAASSQLLELVELYPDYFSSVKLPLPGDESTNALPDVLDEVLWNLDLYRRLQLESGAIRPGIESTAHPRAGETSWQSSMVQFVYAPDPSSSYEYAAIAAKFARVIEKHDSNLAATYHSSAVKAFDWAEVEMERVTGASIAIRPNVARVLPMERATAAVELYWLTGEARFHDVFKSVTILNTEKPAEPEILESKHSAFVYARLPENLADKSLQEKARALILKQADKAVAYGQGNSFGITSDTAMPPMGFTGFFTKPGMRTMELPRAYYLTGDEKYLAAAVRATQFAIGANPDNLTFTTGLGPNPIKHPMKIDSYLTGQPTPIGITAYGISDPKMNYKFDEWAHTYFLNQGGKMVPFSRDWPAYQSYWDIYVVPSTNEFQPHVIAQSAYYWGFLAARK